MTKSDTRKEAINQQFEIVRQTMLLKFDEIDETRQQFANAIALQDGHIQELEENDKA